MKKFINQSMPMKGQPPQEMLKIRVGRENSLQSTQLTAFYIYFRVFIRLINQLHPINYATSTGFNLPSTPYLFSLRNHIFSGLLPTRPRDNRGNWADKEIKWPLRLVAITYCVATSACQAARPRGCTEWRTAARCSPDQRSSWEACVREIGHNFKGPKVIPSGKLT